MPAKRSAATMNGASWAISMRDAGECKREYEQHHNCRIELTIEYYAVSRGSSHWTWAVGATAKGVNWRAGEPVGNASCVVGGNRGARTIAGAILNAVIAATDNLEERRSTADRAHTAVPKWF
jgi:hypothetical protein